jgi:GTPase
MAGSPTLPQLFARTKLSASMTEPKTRAVIVGVQLPDVSDQEHASSLTELSRLATTLGLEVIARVTQKRLYLSKASVVGLGKLKEIAAYTGGDGVIPSPANTRPEKKELRGTYGPGIPPKDEDEDHDVAALHDPQPEDEVASIPTVPTDRRAKVVLVDHDLSPSQARNLERAVDAEVHDRTSVILSIFQRHARTREAKLEVEIARLAYMAPRLREVAGGGDRQRGGIGGRGAGESSMELDKRKIRDRISELKHELEAIEKTARTRRKKQSEQSTVALVGYTNAGKSSLMRGLTGSDVYVADKLFATLDTTVRALKPETKPRILVSDTVGFIKKLPHGLVASFRATLETAAEADLLLHVVDAADPAHESQIAVTRELLKEIGAGDTPAITVMNKIDRVPDFERAGVTAQHPQAVQMSAKDPRDVARLRELLIAFFEREMIDGELFVPYARGAFVNEVHAVCRVTGETYEEDGMRLSVRARPHVLERLTQAISVV